jgi:hypothetical protein
MNTSTAAWVGFAALFLAIWYGSYRAARWLRGIHTPQSLRNEGFILVRGLAFGPGLMALIVISTYVFGWPLIPRGEPRSPDMSLSTAMCVFPLSLGIFILTIIRNRTP